ncbi:delta-1-pyrroline-5-carboxylate dehydrogenase, mitochondrial [Podargus strigoides]
MSYYNAFVSSDGIKRGISPSVLVLWRKQHEKSDHLVVLEESLASSSSSCLLIGIVAPQPGKLANLFSFLRIVSQPPFCIDLKSVELQFQCLKTLPRSWEPCQASLLKKQQIVVKKWVIAKTDPTDPIQLRSACTALVSCIPPSVHPSVRSGSSSGARSISALFSHPPPPPPQAPGGTAEAKSRTDKAAAFGLAPPRVSWLRPRSAAAGPGCGGRCVGYGAAVPGGVGKRSAKVRALAVRARRLLPPRPGLCQELAARWSEPDPAELALHCHPRRWQHRSAIEVTNEPILEFKPGSPERAALQKALTDLKGKTEAIPCVIGGEEVWTPTVRYQVSPFNHAHKVAKYCYADKELINKAINAALAARKEWDLKPVQDRAQIFLKAADMLSGPRRAEVLAKTMIGQGKTVIQAEIDAAAELIDFFRFNAKYALELESSQPISVDVSTNSMVYRGLEGFVAAVSPFNFTAIGGNLAGAPALMGNVVLWKPSDTALLSSYAVYKILLEAGLPPNVVQFVPADGPVFGDAVTSSEHFCGLNFTGSVPTFKRLWKQVSENLDRYRNFPRLAGECGGKNFHLVHSSADVASVVNGTLRSAFEYGGQKCSACSRLYAPDSLWPQIKEKLLEEHGKIKVGDPTQDFGTFFSAVIDDKSFARIKKWIEHAKKSPSLTILAGGGCDNSVGYFIEPCIVQSKDPQDPIMKEEIFGPVLTVYVYPEKRYKEVLELIDTTTPYGLTGAIFAQEKKIVDEARSLLRNAAGNFYINDKSTGAVVAQQPFGGSRISGTNDKPGGPHYILRWTSPQAIKETHVPLTDWRYAYMQ